MSSLIVEVCEVKCVEPHPNAERMCVVTVRGWRVCAGRNPDTGLNQFAPGDKCVYLPPDSVLPPALGERLGVTKYLAPLPKNGEGVRAAGGRLRVASLRGVKSEGLVFAPDNAEWPVGTDVREYYGITKFEPPVKHVAGDAERPHPLFHRYYDMENLRNFPEMFAEGEEVVITEKIHGQNVRLGAVWTEEDGGGRKIELMAGSHDVRRKPISASGKPCLFWGCAPECAWELVRSVAAETDQSVVLFGERFGSGVQDVHYGMHHGAIGFRAFDLTIGGKYLSADDKAALFEKFGVPVVPQLFRGPYSLTTVEALANGPTTLCDALVAGKFGGREGVVVTAAHERSASIVDKFFDRAQAKLISFDYLARKGGTEYH